jgi:hypothetical protein
MLSELLALMVQTALRRIQFIPRTPPCPVDIIMPDRDQNQIGKTNYSQQPIDLARKTARPQDAAKKI